MINKKLRGRSVIIATAAVLAGAGVISVVVPGVSARTRQVAVGHESLSGPGASVLKAQWAVQIRPEVIHLGKASSSPYSDAECKKDLQIACYSPGQLRQAYDVWPLYRKGITGKGETIVIVDSFGSPSVRHDLAVFDRVYRLSAPPSLTVIQPAGKVPPYTASSDREGWAGETDLDVEYAHVMAPGANILLVETPTSENEGTTGFPQIVKAEEYVIDNHLGGVISQSFSATEQTFPTAQSLLNLRSAYIDAAEPSNNVTVLAAAGDSGAADVEYNGTTYYDFPVTSWPDSDPLVTGVGGTELHLDAAGNHSSPDTVWNDTYDPAAVGFGGGVVPSPLAGGGGKSIIFERPAYQNAVAGVVGAQRGVPDVSMSAACNGAVNTYQSFAGAPAGWYPICGTSESTPLFAGVVALADQLAGHPLGLINPALYALSAARAPGIVDIRKGNNTVSFVQGHKRYTVTGFSAKAGYDLASGVGTVNVAKFVPELVAEEASS
jgi:subtilase family serine protease